MLKLSSEQYDSLIATLKLSQEYLHQISENLPKQEAEVKESRTQKILDNYVGLSPSMNISTGHDDILFFEGDSDNDGYFSENGLSITEQAFIADVMIERWETFRKNLDKIFG